ncbi:MAG: hypothetical protein ACRECT_02265 [Thermoplasmata archaeon]
MTLPGPSGAAWALELLLWAGAAAVVGELGRLVAARWVGSWRSLGSVERPLLDFYLGGAVMYLLAALPAGAFVPPVAVGVPVAAAVILLGLLVLRGRRGALGPALRPLAALGRPAPFVALLAALAVFGVELAIALPVATGNTYDSSLLTLYVARLLQDHTIALSFQPYAAVGLLYPQGTTVWLGWAQLLFHLPPARASLLVTPLFLALAPLGAFVFARRTFASDRAALAMALLFAGVASWTRVLVGGSNDFVFAFPLVLLLAGQATGWLRALPSVPDALAWGVLLGYSAAMNPVGAEWLLPTLLLAGLLIRPAYTGKPLRWLGRWAVAAVVSLLAVLPSLIVLAHGWQSPGLTPGAGAAPPGSASGISASQFASLIDPYLFRPTDVWLSPLPVLRLELAILLTVGLGILLVVRRPSSLARYLEPFRPFVGAAVAVILLLLTVLWSASTGFGPAVRFTAISSGSELSIWLFTFYALVGGIVLVLVIERVAADYARGVARSAPPGRSDAPFAPGRTYRHLPSGLPRGALPILLALVIVVPGAVLTPTQLPPVLATLYDDFGNVTAADFALLAYAGAHLPAGGRVLVAPGSAAGFLPGYAPDLVLLFPMVPGFAWLNASYRLVVSELTNATLNTSGLGAMSELDVQYVVVTGNSTTLWPAFSPVPLLAAPSEFPLLWNEGDAYLFQRTTG